MKKIKKPVKFKMGSVTLGIWDKDTDVYYSHKAMLKEAKRLKKWVTNVVAYLEQEKK